MVVINAFVFSASLREKRVLVNSYSQQIIISDLNCNLFQGGDARQFQHL